MRELRVEDALMYLDRVKMEFGDRPQIYNEFLHIMKTFKSQEIDTPGVILRVTQLFQGNKALVLGFNTFLPDGFRIEIPDHGTGTVYYRTPGSHLAPIHAIAMARSRAAENQNQNQFDQQLGVGVGGASQQQQQRSPHMNPSQPPAIVPGAPYGGMPSGMPNPQQMQQQQGQMMGAQGAGQQGGQQQPQGQMPGGPGPTVEHMPMDVRNGFMQQDSGPGQPGGFKQQKKPPQPHLPQYMQQQSHQQPQHRPMHMGMPGHQGQPPPSGGQEVMEPDMQGSLPPHPQQPQMQVGGSGASEPQMKGGMENGVVEDMAQKQSMQQQQQKQQQQQNGAPPVPVEFDHAINYVTTIKRTFANDPDTYKKFLEILHTYQKEQRGIKEVLDEVSVLFADHPVLLKDFTYFLPDAVQQQAKLQLAHAVRQAESRRAALNSKQAIEVQARQQRPVPVPPPDQQEEEQQQQEEQKQQDPQLWNAAQPRKPFGVKQGRSENRERDICRSAIYGVVSFDPVRPPRKNELTPVQAAAKYGRPRSVPEAIIQPTTKEASFFERAKEHLMRKELAPDKAPGSRRHTPHAEFLKCLHLYGAGILSKDELILLLRTLFMQGHAPKSGANASGGINNQNIADAANKLMKEFEQLLVSRGPYARQQSALKDKSKYGGITCKEWDSSLCDDVTPSYKTYPSDYPYEDFFTHSGQTEADADVLNTSVVCVRNEKNGSISKIRALDSLEEYDGVRTRRNIYEEALAKVEDERFEVDLAIETNAAAMRQVEPLAEEITMLKENEEKEGQPIGRLHYELRPKSLTSNHLGAIARLYGEQGDEVINHLMRNPISVLPIVFKRLKEKDVEWRRVRVELSKHWRSLCDSNYEASLDATAYFNRREIEKSINQEAMIEECKRAFHFVKKPKEVHKANSIAAKFQIHHNDAEMLLFHSHVSVEAADNMPHKDVYECVALQVLNSAAKTNADREKSSRIWTEFILPWFNLPTHWFLKELRDKARSEKSSCIVKYAPGQKVKTAFGDGRILAFNEGTVSFAPHYDVDLPFGRGHVRPSSIVHHNATEVQYARENGFMELVKNSDDAMNGNTKREIPASTKLVFGTEKIYVFMRLYCALLSLFNSAKQTMESDGVDNMEVDDASSNRFHAYLSNLKDYINEDIQFKAYELRCRGLTSEKCYKLSAIPRLIEKCADALVKVAREDKLLALFDFYRLNTMDPALQRSQSLSITSDASYRIQYRPSEEKMQFCYLPPEKEMLSHFRNSNNSNISNPERSRMIDNNGATGDNTVSTTEEYVEGDIAEEGEVTDTYKTDEPDNKRARLTQ